mmetsp:Transcript_13746/g.43421  ORF Transcript_13746/g.43421 Transcript_13746/m.43421 type:complete len:251 (+) Transcript_13746:113-865(+)
MSLGRGRRLLLSVEAGLRLGGPRDVGEVGVLVGLEGEVGEEGVPGAMERVGGGRGAGALGELGAGELEAALEIELSSRLPGSEVGELELLGRGLEPEELEEAIAEALGPGDPAHRDGPVAQGLGEGETAVDRGASEAASAEGEARVAVERDRGVLLDHRDVEAELLVGAGRFAGEFGHDQPLRLLRFVPPRHLVPERQDLGGEFPRLAVGRVVEDGDVVAGPGLQRGREVRDAYRWRRAKGVPEELIHDR